MTCNETRLTGWVCESLDDVQAREVERHVLSCETCRKQADALRSGLDAMGLWQAVEPPLGLSVRTIRRLREETTKAPPFWLRPFLWIALGLMAAGAWATAWNRPMDNQEMLVETAPALVAQAPAALHVVVRDHGTQVGIPTAKVTVALRTPDGQSVDLFHGTTDRHGLLDCSFVTPPVAQGRAVLVVDATSLLGQDHTERAVTLSTSHRLLVTTDKPRYKPGETVHARILLIDMETHRPLPGATCRIEVQDPRTNKIFKQQTRVDAWGVTSADVPTGPDSLCGTWTIHAESDLAHADVAVEVSPHLVPKFKVQVVPDRASVRVGERVRGTVRVRYVFGRAVGQGSVALDVLTGGRVRERLQGRLVADGTYPFNVDVKGTGKVTLRATVVDSAGHEEQGTGFVTVTDKVAAAQPRVEPLPVRIVPERATLPVGVSSRLYVVTTPDANVTLEVNGISQTARSSRYGVARFDESPSSEMQVEAQVTRGEQSGHAQAKIPVSTDPGVLLVRPDRTVLQPGETLHVDLRASQLSGPVSVDVLRAGRVLWAGLGTVPGQVDVPISAAMGGELTLRAVAEGREGPARTADACRILVPLSSQLRVSVQAARPEIRPGESQKLTFQVQDEHGQPVEAALGVAVVDQAVAGDPPDLQALQAAVSGADGAQAQALSTSPGDASRDEAVAALLAAAPSQVDTLDLGSSYSDKLVAFQEQRARLQFLAGLGMFGLLVWTAIRERRRPVWYLAMFGLSVVLYFVLDLGPVFLLLVCLSTSILAVSSQSEFQVILVVFLLLAALAGCGGGYKSAVGGHGTNTTMYSTDNSGRYPTTFRSTDNTVKLTPTPPPSRVTLDGVHVRQDFPETLYWNPSVITDAQGHAQVDLPSADSITTWQVYSLANSQNGLLGLGSTDFKAFQDFFVEPDVPVELVRGDSVDIPVAVYNYLPRTQTISLDVVPGGWFTIRGGLHHAVTVPSGQVGMTLLPLRCTLVGDYHLTLRARSSSGTQDAVSRPIHVAPDGHEVTTFQNGVLHQRAAAHINIPADRVPGGTRIQVRLVPGAVADCVQGLKSLLQMPHGCFEQTTSSTYPDILILRYLHASRQTNATVEKQANADLDVGYQKLLAFERPQGGFSLWGTGSPDVTLSAYGLAELSDMREVHPIDGDILARTARYLVSQQATDGSWVPPTEWHELRGLQSTPLQMTGFVTWSLAQTRDTAGETASKEALDRAVDWLRRHAAADSTQDDQGLALAVLALERAAPGDADATLRQNLRDRMARRGWSTDLMATALTVQALVARHEAPPEEAVTALVQGRGSFGSWETTYLTVEVLRALVALGVGHDKGQVEVGLNSVRQTDFHLSHDTMDTVFSTDLRHDVRPGDNEVTLSGDAEVEYQVVGRWFEPVRQPRAHGLSIQVSYDRTRLRVGESVAVTAHVRNLTGASVSVGMIRLPVPPGFSFDTTELDRLKSEHVLDHAETGPREVVLYVPHLPVGQTDLTLHVRARWALDATCPPAEVWAYYRTDLRGLAPGAHVTVTH